MGDNKLTEKILVDYIDSQEQLNSSFKRQIDTLTEKIEELKEKIRELEEKHIEQNSNVKVAAPTP